jgi:hypothetical protein
MSRKSKKAERVMINIKLHEATLRFIDQICAERAKSRGVVLDDLLWPMHSPQQFTTGSAELAERHNP